MHIGRLEYIIYIIDIIYTNCIIYISYILYFLYIIHTTCIVYIVYIVYTTCMFCFRKSSISTTTI